MKFTKAKMVKLIASRMDMRESRVRSTFSVLEDFKLLLPVLKGKDAREMTVTDMAVLIITLLASNTPELAARRGRWFCLLTERYDSTLVRYFVELMQSRDVASTRMTFHHEDGYVVIDGYSKQSRLFGSKPLGTGILLGTRTTVSMNGYVLADIMGAYDKYHELQALAVHP